MESSSVKLYSKKRKKQYPSLPDPLIGVFTRSKSQVYVHHNRSGRTRPDASRKSNFHSCSTRPKQFPGKPNSVQPGLPKKTGTEPFEAYLELNDEISSRISSIKDLRAHRVFSPAVNPILEEENGKRNGDSKLLQNVDLDTNSDQCMDLDVGDKDVENTQSVETMPSFADAKENNSKNGLNLMKDEAISNGSISRSKTVLNSCAKRKVFKTPSSFNYRRLLPYLMDIVKEESSASKIEIVDVEFPNKFQESSGSSPKMPSFMENDCAAKLECVGARPNPADSFENEEIQRFDKEQSCILQNLISVDNQLEHRSCENGVSGVEDSVEEERILTKPDSDVHSATASRDGGRNKEVNTLLTEKPKGTSVGCMSIGNKSRHSLNGKSGTNWKSETFLTPCSRVRVIQPPSSVSYRRLLPYMIDVAKKNSCDSQVIQHPKSQIDSPDVHPLSYATSNEENPVKKIRMEGFSEQPHTEDEEQNLMLALIPNDNVSSSGTDNNLSPSTPPLYNLYSNNSSKVGPSSIVSDDTDLVMPLDLPKEERLLVQNSPKKFESEISHNDTMDCNGKSNCSAVELYSIVDHGILTDTKIKCMAVNVEAYKSNEELVERVTSNQSQSQIEFSDNLVAHTDVPFRGILKKNPKGCRGQCNCLNCASFRLHAERAFEFSRNQMLDAEEVAWNLMKELANVRHILEKSAVHENDLTTIRLNQAQVKEVCNKSLETENLAKERLNRLNYDLNIHCRIPTSQRPSVTFANYIQERVIPKSDVSTSPETSDK